MIWTQYSLSFSKQAQEKLEKEWNPYAGVMKEKGYIKRDIPTYNQVKRYLKKEKNLNKDVLGQSTGPTLWKFWKNTGKCIKKFTHGIYFDGSQQSNEQIRY